MGNPMAILNFSIHAPGLGRNFSQPGWKLSTTYGNANPRPTVKKNRMIPEAGWAKAKPRAAPKNGAVQGVAKIVANTPLKNAPELPCLDDRVEAAPITRPPGVTSNNPNKFRATRVTNTVSITRNIGLPNCIPQPALCPAAFT